MRVCSILVLAMTTLLATTSATASVNSNAVKASLIAAPSGRSLLTRENNGAPQRLLRVRGTEDGDESEDSNEEEARVVGTDIVMIAHGLDRADAKMVRQIAKGRSPEHALDKHNVPYSVINRQRVYSLDDPDYARYVKWLKRYRDNPLTFPKTS